MLANAIVVAVVSFAGHYLVAEGPRIPREILALPNNAVIDIDINTEQDPRQEEVVCEGGICRVLHRNRGFTRIVEKNYSVRSSRKRLLKGRCSLFSKSRSMSRSKSVNIRIFRGRRRF